MRLNVIDNSHSNRRQATSAERSCRLQSPVGESDAKGEGPKDKAITPDDVAATFYATLGIDPEKEYHTPSGRPVMIVRNGTPIKGLL